MKKFITILALSLTLNIYLSAQWEVMNEGVNYMSNVDFVSSEVGWTWINTHTYEGAKELFKTTDFGKTWAEIDLSNIEGIVSVDEIDFTSEDVGYIRCYGNSNNLYATTDGGTTWMLRKKILYVNGDFQALDDSTVILNAGPGQLIKSTDRGINWEDISPTKANIDFDWSFWFFNKNEGILTMFDDKAVIEQSTYYTTADGGTTWIERNFEKGINAKIFKTLNNGTTYFLQRTEQDSSNVDLLKLFKTTDAGKSWTMELTPPEGFEYVPVSEDSILKFQFEHLNLNLDHGVGLKTIPARSANLFKKTSEELLLVCDIFNGAISEPFEFRSNDSGQTWHMSTLTYSLDNVEFVDNQHGFATGDGKAVLETNDGGRNWFFTFVTDRDRISGLHFVNSETGFANVNRDNILKTTDGGETWVEKKVIDLPNLRGISSHFKDPDNGWLVGKSKESKYVEIYESNNGGETWTLSWQSSKEYHESGYLTIRSKGQLDWISGPEGLLLINDGHSWEELNSPTNMQINDMYFTDKDQGWVCVSEDYKRNYRENPSKIYKTTDGGQTWDSIEVNYHIRNILFVDNLRGWAVGHHDDYLNFWDVISGTGVILATKDGGNSWEVEMDSLSNIITALDYKDEILWAVGYNGLILKNSLEPTGVDDHTFADINSNGIILEQNYPNPFSDKTTIEYHLNVNANVDLSIYNSLGQKVATLVSAEQSSGTYQVEWDATSFPSGIYLLNLSDGKHIVQKKIIKK